MTDDKNMNTIKPRRSPSSSAGSQGRGENVSKPFQQTNKSVDQENSKTGVFEQEFLPVIIAVRALAFIIWMGSILYATYHVFLAAEEQIPWMNDPIMNPGPFTELLNRGRDDTDEEWKLYTGVFFSKLIFLYPAYLLAVSVCQTLDNGNEISSWISPIMSFAFLWNMVGLNPTLFLFLTPVIYWLMIRLRSKLLIWSATFAFLTLMGTGFVRTLFPNVWLGHEGVSAEYAFVITAAWNYARCISFCFDTWDRPVSQTNSMQSLVSFWKYIFYLPLTTFGPLVLFEHFEKQILNKPQGPTNGSKIGISQNIVQLSKGMLRMFLLMGLTELLYHYLYFRPLSFEPVAIRDMNLWAVCGAIYWLGQIFTIKYKVMYGIPSCIAEFDGLQMYPLPRCPAYLHRYSVLWKDFDRGLYLFLVKYIYGPTTELVRRSDRHQILSPEIHKLIGSFASYVYVYVWHSTTFEVLVWAAFNFIGITIERFGSLIKRKLDSKYVIEPMIWDFIVEPIVTVPLAAMSILNSSVFCGSLNSAIWFSVKLWRSRSDCYLPLFLYCFTHVAVTIRTWDKFYQAVITAIKGSKKAL